MDTGEGKMFGGVTDDDDDVPIVVWYEEGGGTDTGPNAAAVVVTPSCPPPGAKMLAIGPSPNPTHFATGADAITDEAGFLPRFGSFVLIGMAFMSTW